MKQLGLPLAGSSLENLTYQGRVSRSRLVNGRTDEASPGVRPPQIFIRPQIPTPSVVFETFWRFAAERQAIFFRRLQGEAPPWSTCPILQRYKFTNAYRASDRISQYLIRHVIYAGDPDPQEVFFRTILFKLFNSIGTWQRLTAELGVLTAREFSVDRYDAVLSRAQANGLHLYSGAYIMPSALRFGSQRKHTNHLRLLSTLLTERVVDRLVDAKTLAAAYKTLASYYSLGPFLAFQFVIDLNYSTILNFDEMEFVVPGPGARDGIRKCFDDLGDFSEVDVIRYVTENQVAHFARLGLPFRSLWSRALQLIDSQNVFCEVAKYARLAHPDVRGLSGRHRIKQLFRPTQDRLSPWYPPKWGLNEKVAASLSDQIDAP
jgi:alpha-glutamyl/putrescinyl thymine pyrophosphorylase clade 1